ncbi:pantoate--beta-alanine ligase [Aristolochia californica]|uniref:pantoate--beta-alanine ligase n=1 Tax=Aristolochia californica TaxID=171875 RepID=UPI0035D7B87E
MAKEPEIIKDKDQMRSWSRSTRSQGNVLALVPTMGYLHDGHLSLIRQAQKQAEIIVVSIYVNPAQFSPSEDLSTYPSDFDGDLKKLREIGVDAVFHPQNLYDYGSCGETINESVDKMEFTEQGERKVLSCIEDKGEGRLGHETWIRIERLEKGLCGKSRPVFFRGVTTVVAKLFNIVEPDIAIFGKKDYQQWRIICRMVRDLDFGIQVIGSDVVRETDGLAMSSRNVHLTPEEREKALSISQSLLKAKFVALKGQTSCTQLRNSLVQAITDSGGRVDYAEIVDQETLVAVDEIKAPVVFCVAAWFGKVRLIDNVEINI